MAPGDAEDLPAMLEFALQHDGPCAIRYPKAKAETISADRGPGRVGPGRSARWGRDGVILCYGVQLAACLRAADDMRPKGWMSAWSMPVLSNRSIARCWNERSAKICSWSPSKKRP